jgi:hypothetical protein
MFVIRTHHYDKRIRRAEPPPPSADNALTPQEIAARAASPGRSPAPHGHTSESIELAATQAALAMAASASSSTVTQKRPAISLRTRIVHVLAIGPADLKTLEMRLNQRPEVLLRELGESKIADRHDTIYTLKPEFYRTLDIYEWEYTPEERKVVLERAKQTFDQLGLPSNARERIMLLAPEARPAGWDQNITPRDRVIHALAIEPMGFNMVREKSGLKDTDEIRHILQQVAQFQNNAWTLKDICYKEVQLSSWPSWTVDERKSVARKMRSTFEAMKLPPDDKAWEALADYPKSPESTPMHANTATSVGAPSTSSTPSSLVNTRPNSSTSQLNAAGNTTGSTAHAAKAKVASETRRKGAATIAKITSQSKRPGSTSTAAKVAETSNATGDAGKATGAASATSSSTTGQAPAKRGRGRPPKRPAEPSPAPKITVSGKQLVMIYVMSFLITCCP